MIFNSNVHASQIDIIKGIFQLNLVSKYEKYIGLPSYRRIKKPFTKASKKHQMNR